MFPLNRIAGLGICLIAIPISAIGSADDEPQGNTVAKKAIEEVLKEHTEELMSLPGVIGIAQGLCDGQPCIKVYVTEKKPDLDQKIPGVLGGYSIQIEETGRIQALPENQN